MNFEPTIFQLRDNVVNFPRFVGYMLKDFYPQIGDRHRKPIVETLASFFNGTTESGHSTHFLWQN